MARNFPESPKEVSGFNLSNSGDGDQYLPDEEYIKVKLYFFTESKALKQSIFTEEWYTVMADEYEEDQVNKDKFEPWLEVRSHCLLVNQRCFFCSLV
jgi:hypothetical protein